MKKKLLSLSALILMTVSMVSAQILCETPSNRDRVNRAYRVNTSAMADLSLMSFNFSNILSDGWRQGTLTQHEIFVLENDFRRLEREVRWATMDGRIDWMERNQIQLQSDRLNRSLRREWNDNDVREGKNS